MQSSPTTITQATPPLSIASNGYLPAAGSILSHQRNARRARCMFLKAQLLELREQHRQALSGTIEMTLSERVAMQEEMFNINFELHHNI